MKKCGVISFVLLFCLFAPIYSQADDKPDKAPENAVAVGYGFGIFNNDLIGKIDQGNYNFFQFTYTHERHWFKDFYILAEPYVTYVTRPTEGLDTALALSGRYYFNTTKQDSFFATLGVGAVYSTLQYSEQPHHAFFLVQGGMGYRWKNFFIEDKLRHYSNGYTSSRNKAIHSNIISIGFFF